MSQTVENTARAAALAASAVFLTAAHSAAPSATTPPQAATTQTREAGSPEGAVDAFHSALKRGDAPAALALMDEKAMIFESGDVEINRAEYAARHLQEDIAFSASVTRTIERRQVERTPHTAWVSSIETVTGNYHDHPIHSRSLETMLLKNVQGAWRIVHIHWSSTKIKAN